MLGVGWQGPDCGTGIQIGLLTKQFSNGLWRCTLESLLGCTNLHILNFRASDDLKCIKPILTYMDHP